MQRSDRDGPALYSIHSDSTQARNSTRALVTAPPECNPLLRLPIRPEVPTNPIQLATRHPPATDTSLAMTCATSIKRRTHAHQKSHPISTPLMIPSHLDDPIAALAKPSKHTTLLYPPCLPAEEHHLHYMYIYIYIRGCQMVLRVGTPSTNTLQAKAGVHFKSPAGIIRRHE
ncbi:hypothetical protein PMIN04_005682 [Paraphaeosphaeria minitans]